MSQLTDNLNQIVSIKSDIKDAIEAKGVDMTGVSFGSFADKIGEITTQFVTETLSVTNNGTYTPGQGVDGYSQVVVSVPQSVTGFTDKEITERQYSIETINNSASYVGIYAFYRNPDTIKTVDLPNCTRVGAYAFYYNFSISRLSLPVCGEIQASAFVACLSLSELYLPACLNIESQAFNDCEGLVRVDLPVCSQIGSNAFRDGHSLTDVSLPECLYIYNQAFMYCYTLSQISLPVCSRIYSSAFSNCSNLRSLTLATEFYKMTPMYNGVIYKTPLGSGEGHIYVASDMYSRWIVSKGWSSLSSLFVSVNQSLPVLSYSDGLVYGLTRFTDTSTSLLSYLGITSTSITRLSLTGVSYLSSVFYQCTNLTEADFPACKTIDNLAFQNCYSLSKVSFPVCETLMSQVFENCSALTDVYLPVCKTVGALAFSKCSSLSRIDLPACENISWWAFQSCTSLTEISLPVCSRIDNNAFNGCTSLSEVYLPVCSYIGSTAFYIYKTTSFSLTLGYDGVVEAPNQPVYNYSNLYIYVPSSLVDAYKSSPMWTFCSSRIFPITE